MEWSAQGAPPPPSPKPWYRRESVWLIACVLAVLWFIGNGSPSSTSYSYTVTNDTGQSANVAVTMDGETVCTLHLGTSWLERQRSCDFKGASGGHRFTLQAYYAGGQAWEEWHTDDTTVHLTVHPGFVDVKTA